MATTTEYKPGLGYKTTDENGRITYSQDEPPNAPPSNNAGRDIAPNTMGVVRTIEVFTDKKTGKKTSIPRINGEIDPAFTEKQREENRQRIYKEFQAQAAAQEKARQQAEAAKLAEKERLKISNNYGVSAGVQCKPEVMGAPDVKYEVDIGKPGSEDPGNLTVWNPKTEIPFTPDSAGCTIYAKVEVNAPNIYERVTGDEKNAQRARDAFEKKKEIEDEINKIKENVKKNIAEGMPPEAVNEQFMRENAELIRKYGEEAAKALIK